jgi:hypothetical protein
MVGHLFGSDAIAPTHFHTPLQTVKRVDNGHHKWRELGVPQGGHTELSAANMFAAKNEYAYTPMYSEQAGSRQLSSRANM